MKHAFNKLTTIAAVLLLGGPAMAQSNAAMIEPLILNRKPPISIGITGGFSGIMGNFAKTNYADNKSGFATSGFNVGVTGAYMLNKHWGITALASYHGYGNTGLQNLAVGYKESFAIDSSTAYVNGRNYTINLMVGPYYSIPVSSKFSIDFRGLIGLTNAHLAGNKVDVEDNAASSFEQKPATANTLGYQLGAGAKYSFCKRFGVMVNLDYYYSKPDFAIDNVNRANNAGRIITKYNEAITGVNANVSFVYNLRE